MQDLLRNKIAEAQSTVQQIEVLKQQEDATLKDWKQDLEVVQEKVAFLETSLVDSQ